MSGHLMNTPPADEAHESHYAEIIHRILECYDTVMNVRAESRAIARAVIAAADEERKSSLSAAWQEGFHTGEHMAHMYGHVDYWENWPENPYESQGVES